MHTNVGQKPNGTDHLRDFGVDVRILLKWTFEKNVVRMIELPQDRI
jgi:hypothetical protein